MNAFSTAAALTVLAATTAAFAAQTQAQPSPPSRLVPDTIPSSYQHQGSAVTRRDSEVGANSDAASCRLKGEAVKGSATSTAFAATAAQDGMVEVALAGLALRKSGNQEVRQLAQRMVQDYAQSNERLDSIVKCEGLVLPTELDAKHSVTIERLDATSGSEFDKAYLKHIGEKHSKAVTLFESASRSGDPDMAAFARNGLSMLQEHQELADNLRVAMGSRVASMH
jgi:predicted outer membrane protein